MVVGVYSIKEDCVLGSLACHRQHSDSVLDQKEEEVKNQSFIHSFIRLINTHLQQLCIYSNILPYSTLISLTQLPEKMTVFILLPGAFQHQQRPPESPITLFPPHTMILIL